MAMVAKKLLKRLLLRRAKPYTSVATVATTYFERGNQWYLPALAGPATFLPKVARVETIREVFLVMEQLSPDKYMEFLLNFYREGLERFGDDWAYADINTILFGFSKVVAVRDYLEIGVRRGRSMAMVASQSPKCAIVGFDMWIKDYAGMDNPGELLVRSELKKVGHQGSVEFIDGDSRLTVPRFFQSSPDRSFDLITVDGDHSTEGARCDLLNVIPRIRIGGVLVFDDISNQSFPQLAGVWQDLVGANPRFAAHSFNEVGFGVGFAIRKY
ncbi:MAG: class I SAM-dependent methyltransferase [Bryobacteraceae bacterium]